MATLYIAEFTEASLASAPGHQPIASMPPQAEQTKAIGGASAQSNAFSAQTRTVRLNTDVACSVAFGSNPTAAATNMRLSPDHTEYFAVQPGHKVAVIANT